MINVEKEIDRILTLLRNKIREQGFTQLQVQAELDWGRSYISQLLTKQKSLRVEQVLKILDVIGIEPAEFYAELYSFPSGDPLGWQGEPYSNRDHPAYDTGMISEGGLSVLDGVAADGRRTRSAVESLVETLYQKKVLDDEDLDPVRRLLDGGIGSPN